jgi:hypothetical protein
MSKFEVGRITLSGTIDAGITQTVTFQLNYTDPVVIVYKADNNTGFSAGRARNVSGSSANIFHEEPDNGNGSTNTFTYLVAESGSYEIDGYQIEAGTVSSSAQTQSSQSETVNFQQAFSSTPVVLHGLQSYNNNEFMSTSALSVSSSSFSFGLENLETGASSVTETLGYFAIDEVSNGGTIDGNVFETKRTSNSVTDNSYTVNFSQSYSSAPDVIAAGQLVDGGDGYVTVGTGVTSTSSHAFFVHEDRRSDSETGHTTEVIGYLVIEQGAFVGQTTGPTNVSIDNSIEDELTISWSQTNANDAYNIYRSNSSGSQTSDYTQIATVGATSFIDTNLEDGERYYYRISAENIGPVAESNLELWYPFEDGTADDKSNTEANGSVFGATYNSSGGPQNKGAYSFDGSNDYIALPYNLSQSSIGSFTVTAWVKVPSNGGDWAILDFDRSEYFTAAAGVPNGSASGEGDRIGFHTADSGSNISDMWSNVSIRDNTWKHIAWRFDDNANQKAIFIDGVLDSTQSENSVGNGVTRYGYIGDGSESSSFNSSKNDNYYEGDATDIRFYNISLSDTQIQNIYNNTS